MKNKLNLSMKTCHKILAFLAFTACSLTARAQPNQKAAALLFEGFELHDAGKYDKAAQKYRAIIKIDSNYYDAYYALGFTLKAAKKQQEAITALEHALAINPGKGQAYNLLGSIYDEGKQSDKAINYFENGISADPEYQHLYFGLAMAYCNKADYADAEAIAITAIKIDPKEAEGYRLLAKADSGQNKTANALFAWCTFLTIEPQTKQSAEAIACVKSIVKTGIKTANGAAIDITTALDSASNNSISQLKRHLSGPDSLMIQLTPIFKAAANVIIGNEESFINFYFTGFFTKLGNSEHMAAFAYFISMSAYTDKNAYWFKEHISEGNRFMDWVHNAR
jgi:tetratricopeptide (TPR) repeat protein